MRSRRMRKQKAAATAYGACFGVGLPWRHRAEQATSQRPRTCFIDSRLFRVLGFVEKEAFHGRSEGDPPSAASDLLAGMASLVCLVSCPDHDSWRTALHMAAISRAKVGYQQIRRHK